MKKVISLFVLLCLTQVCLAQDTEPKTAAEQFSSKSGNLIKKEYIDVSKLKGLEIQVLIYTNMVSEESIKSLRFQSSSTSNYSSDTHIAVLDLDEIDGLMQSLKIISTDVINTTPQAYTEVIFKSKSGFRAGAYYSKNKWTVFVKLEEFDNDSYTYLKPADIGILADGVRQVKKLTQ